MQITIQERDKLSTGERKALENLTRVVYPTLNLRKSQATPIEWAPTTSCILIWNEYKELVSHVGVLTRRARYNGQEVFICGPPW